MGGALALAWARRWAGRVVVAEADAARRDLLKREGVPAVAHWRDARAAAQILVLAVKPQQCGALTRELEAQLSPQLLVSVMAGVPLASLKFLQAPVARVMPNLPATVGAGMSVGIATSDAARDAAQELFLTVGDCHWVQDEAMLDAATAISGSGPGYVFYFLKTLQEAAQQLGFDPQTARALALTTLQGSAALAAQRDAGFEDLLREVASHGGTTQAAIARLQSAGWADHLHEAVKAAHTRARELAASS